MDEAQQQLQLLLKISSILSTPRTLEQVFHSVLEEVIATLQAERGFVILDEGRHSEERWRPLAAFPATRPDDRFSRSLVEQVMDSERPLLTLDSLSEPSPSPSIMIQGIRSVMIAPLRWSGQLRGALYVDHRIRSGAFQPSHLEILTAIAQQSSRALENADLQARMEEVQRGFLQSGTEPEASARTLDFALESLTRPERLSGPTSFEAHLEQVQEPAGLGLEVFVFGPLRVFRDGFLVEEWQSRKDRDLLAFLALHPDQVVHEDRLVDLFWGQGGRTATHSLHNSITQIRRRLGDSQREFLQRVGQGYRLALECRIDYREFLQLLREGRQAMAAGQWEQAVLKLSRADALGRRQLLEGQTFEWLESLRFDLSQHLLQARGLLAEYFHQRGRYALAVELWKQVLERDNCCQEAYRGLIEAHLALGERPLARRAYQACVAAYQKELDLPPPEELQALLDFSEH